ncbi:MAG TPA: TerB family tellurite resistance protein [Cyclobacteriaceae bacterium]|nr:TerB family tellurite resistance protein [Cyclobacteriaceae bacterium]HRF32360.1 TerB family tellurite resistance protein [Cyclobacteriaceae bacterium]
MKKIILLSLMIAAMFDQVKAQSDEAQQLLLNWEKLQTLEKMLDNMYMGYKILDNGYTTIKKIAEGDYSIHQAFLDGLMAVNPSVRNYKRIPLIIEYQKLLVQEYKRAWKQLKNDPNLTIDEIFYIESVYKFILQASLRNLDDLAMIITATKLRMSDDERMRAIDNIFFDMENRMVFLRGFNNDTRLLAIQRAFANNNQQNVKKLYGVN